MYLSQKNMNNILQLFELETKAMLQRDKKVNPKDWIKPTAPTAISSKIAGVEERKRSEGSSPLAKWRQITCPGSGIGNQLSCSEDPDLLQTHRLHPAANNSLLHKRVV
uniref:Uncharacterized protein n=1 Tax=Rhodnius prolixus TaxID=13249 RepID=T1HFK1_RHOPR